MWNSKEWNYSNVLFESLVLNFNPLPQDVFIRNESEHARELHEELNEKSRTPQS